LVDLAHALGLTVTAESIETRAQFGRFRAAGCDTGQGSLFAPPCAPEQIDALLRAFHPLCDISTEAR
jgi:EAL domain-containing protein (putative c-di-GMP-specific phosphodiesterase class I)